MRRRRLQFGGTVRGYEADRRAQQPVAGSTHVPRLLTQFGVVAPGVVLREAGLARDALCAATGRIPYRAWGDLLRRSADASGCPQFGLLLGRTWQLDDLGPIAEAIRSSATLGEALETLADCDALSNGGGVGFVMRRAAIVDVGYAIHYDRIKGADQIGDCILAAICNVIRELAGPAWTPSVVFLPHAQPDDAVHYRNVFKVVPRFDSEICALRFSAYWLDRPLEGADPRRRRAALIRQGELPRANLMHQALRGLRLMLMNGKSSGDDLAAILGMHRRTLNRRLRRLGTTYQEILDRVRFEVARQFLAHSNVPLDDIAAALGYAGVSPFMRSFRRWSGVTPGEWRRRALRRPIEPAAPPLVAVSSPRATASPLVTPRLWNVPSEEGVRDRRASMTESRRAGSAVAGIVHS